ERNRVDRGRMHERAQARDRKFRLADLVLGETRRRRRRIVLGLGVEMFRLEQPKRLAARVGLETIATTGSTMLAQQVVKARLETVQPRACRRVALLNVRIRAFDFG